MIIQSSTQQKTNKQNPNPSTTTLSRVQINKKEIQNFILGYNDKSKIISRQTFNNINQYQDNIKINIKQKFNQSTLFVKLINKWLKNNINVGFGLFTQHIAQKLFQQPSHFRLMQTGQYYSEYDSPDGKQYLLFTEHHMTWLKAVKAIKSIKVKSKQYNGFKYKYSKQIYCGNFTINNNMLVYCGQGLSIRKIDHGNNYQYFYGRWANDQIQFGIKEIYYNQHKISYYTGKFRNMKFHGDGILNTKNQKLQGNFQYGKCISQFVVQNIFNGEKHYKGYQDL